jgi:hypothetical protein
VPDITSAIDETGANVVVPRAVASLPLPSQSGSGNLGPFGASWSATGMLSGGMVDLIPPPPDVIRITGLRLDYTVGLTLSVDLSFLNFCLPQVCVNLPFIGRVCTPRVCVTFPTISIPVSFSSFVNFDADFRLSIHLTGATWFIDAVVVGVPFLQLSPAAAALLSAVGLAAGAALIGIPFIGPILAGAVIAITSGIGLAGVLGLLGPLISPFVAGLTFNIAQVDKVFEVIPAALPDPAVDIVIDNITAMLDGSGGEDELVVTVDVSPPP